MYTRIYDTLAAAGFDAYHVGQHKGLCETPYIVIKEGGQSSFLTSLSRNTVDIIIYYPLGRYSQVMAFMREVTTALRVLRFMKPTGDVTPIIVDEGKRAYTASVRYQIFKRRENA